MAMTLRLKPAIEGRAKAYAETVGMPMSTLVALALVNYLDFHEARAFKAAQRSLEEPTRSRPAARAQPVRSAAPVPKVGPNELCPCGSGVKYKRCHGARA